MLLYRVIDYTVFRMTAGKVGLQYPWRFEVMMDVAVMFLVSTVWWWLMREVAVWKQKNQQR